MILKSFKTKAEIKYQQWLLRTIYPKTFEGYLEKFREFLVKLSRKGQIDLFSDGKYISQAFSKFYALRNNRVDSPFHYAYEPACMPEDWKLNMFTPFTDPLRINQYIQFNIPPTLKKTLKRLDEEESIMVSIGYGLGNLEWTVLNERRVETVEGIEFTQGINDTENFRKYLQNCILRHKELIIKQKQKTSIKERLRLYLTQYLKANSNSTIEEIKKYCKYSYDMIEIMPNSSTDDLTKIVDAYKIRIDAIAGTARNHRLFAKKIINTSQKTISETCKDIAEFVKNSDADIVLLKDSLHHSSHPYKYLKSVFEALKEGSYMIVIEPFMFDDDSLGSSFLRTAFETTLYPDSLMTLRRHEKWINTFLLYGATIEDQEMYSGVSYFNINYDPFHRFEICLRKQKSIVGEIPEFLNRGPSTEEIDEAVKWVNDSKFIAQGTCYEDDANALVKNRLWLSGLIKEHSLTEVPYFELFNHEYYERSKEREKIAREKLDSLLLRLKNK